jgi:DNA-binding transcriptional ArsR family regulator
VIRIELDEQTLERTRIAVSPLWETVCSLHLLYRRGGRPPFPYERWAVRANEVLAELSGGPMGWYAAVSEGRSPDFLSPIPTAPAPTVEEELAALRATDPVVIEAQLARHYPDGVPAALVPFRERPERALAELADGLHAYWRGAIEPYWPGMRAMLDEEVLHRARALAADGPDALLAGLHERVRWERPVLTLVKPLEHADRAFDKRLLLIPLIFSRGALMCSTDDPEVVAVSYQSRGAAVLLGDDRPATEPGPPDRLSILLGRGRSAVLRALTAPASTATLADQLGLAPSTVSEHLAALLAAGVVTRRRAGRRVLYQLDSSGTALVALLGPAEHTHPTVA